MCFRKVRRAQNKDDFETWMASEMSNTINLFEMSDIRATTIVVSENNDSNDETILGHQNI